MKLKLSLPVGIIAIIMLFASCSKKADVPVPVDAALVFHFNGKALNEKLSWDEVKQSEWYKEIKAEAEKGKEEIALRILDNPENSGVDIKSDAYFFFKTSGSGGYGGFVANLKDEAAFAVLAAKIKDGKSIKKDGDISIIADRNAVITWKANRLALIFDAPFLGNLNAGAFDKEGSSLKSFSEDSLILFAKEIYTLKSSKSIGSNSKFTDMIKDGGDAHFWINSSNIYGSSLSAMLALTKISTLLEGNYLAGTLNFENGKIAIESKQYMNKELLKIFKNNPMKNFDVDVLKKIPSGDVAAAIAINIPPASIKDIVTLVGLDGLANMFLGKANITFDDLIKATKGDLFFSISDFKLTKQKHTIGEGPDAYTYESEAPSAKALFGTAIGDKASFDKVAALLSKELNNEPGLMDAAKKNVFQQTKDNWFLAGNDSVYINGFGAAKTDHSFISKLSGHPMAGFADIQKFITAAKPTMDSNAVVIANESLKTWQDLIFYGGEIKNDAATSHFEINLVDKNTNSLKQINKFIDFVFIQDKKQSAKRKEATMDFGSDTTIIDVPVTPPPSKK